MEKPVQLSKLLHGLGMVCSVSEGKRMIKQGAVEIDGEKVITDLVLLCPDEKSIYNLGD